MDWKRVLFLFGIAAALAVFEIQIEGASGWAEKLPCWRATPDSWQQKIYGALMNDKPCDGFHLSELVLLLLVFHLPFAWGVKWGFAEECKLMAYFFVTTILWDFLWFIFNPAYGWANFDGAHIWWHKHWIGPFPKDYYGGIPVVLVLACLGSWLSGNFLISLREIAINLGGLIGLTTVTTIIAEFVRRHA